jgi:Protein of unknown function (DUF3551)
MRTIPLVLIAFAALSLSGTGARAGSWCAFYGTDITGTNCSFNSLEQCRGTLVGLGGFCRPNPYPGTNFGRGRTWNAPPAP